MLSSAFHVALVVPLLALRPHPYDVLSLQSGIEGVLEAHPQSGLSPASLSQVDAEAGDRSQRLVVRPEQEDALAKRSTSAPPGHRVMWGIDVDVTKIPPTTTGEELAAENLSRCFTYSYIGRKSEHEDKEEAEHAEQENNHTKEEGESEEEDEEEEAQECYLTPQDDFWLEFMWLPENALLILILATVYLFRRRFARNAASTAASEAGEGGAVEWLEFLDGKVRSGLVFNLTLLLVSFTSWLLFAINTELQITEDLSYGEKMRVVSKESEPMFQRMALRFELASCAIFAVVLAARVALQLKVRGVGSALPDMYNWLDLAALIPTLLDTFFTPASQSGLGEGPGGRYPNLLWLVMMRIVGMVMIQTAGAGLHALVDVVEEKGWLLFTAYVMGLCIALALSGMYYLACQSGGNPDALVWTAAGWNRMESIPASMFFVLVNLRAEHPLADEFVEANAVWPVLISALLGVGFFAIPTGIISDSFEEKITEAASNRRASRSLQPGVVVEEALFVPADQPHSVTPVYAWIACSFGYLTIGAYATFTYFLAKDPTHRVVHFYPYGELVASSLFFLEWVWQLHVSHGSTLYSLHSFLDVASSLPCFLACSLLVLGKLAVTSSSFSWLVAFCVLRVFKPDKYLRAFRVLKEIVEDTGMIFLATAGLAFFLWVSFCVAMYYIERDNPDEDVRTQYASVMRTMWTMFVNLRGEFPWCDYSAAGKALETFAMMATIGIFSIPVGLFGNFFKDRLGQSEDGQPGLPSVAWYGSWWETDSKCFAFIYGPAPHSTRTGYASAYAALAVFCNSTSVAVAVLLSLSYFDDVNPPICKKDSFCLKLQTVFVVLDAVLLCFFIIDFVLRMVATQGRYILSGVAFCNVLSLAACAWSLHPASRRWIFHPQLRDGLSWDDYVIVLRLLRVMLLEEYSGSVQMLGRITWQTRVPLAQAFYTMVCSWIIFATLLYLCEKSDMTEDDDIPQAERYSHLFTSMQYTLVHLFGDYPITNYSPMGKLVHLPMAVIGVGLTAAPAGIFSAAFSQELDHERQLYNKQVRAVLRLQAAWLVKKGRLESTAVVGLGNAATLQMVVKSAAAAKQELRRKREEAKKAFEGNGVMAIALALAQGQGSVGEAFNKLRMGVLVFNIVCVMVESMPEVKEGRMAGGSHAHGEELYPRVFLMLEIMCTFFFILEYFVGFLAAPGVVADRFSRRAYVTRPLRILDLLCILPCFLMAAGLGRRESLTVETLRVLRVFRVFSWTIFERDMECMSHALGTVRSKLLSPLCLAIMLWALSTVLFFHFENVENGPQKEAFSTLPVTAYYTAIFLLGEWAMVDFCWKNAVICCFYNLLGVAIFAIPVGLISQAVQVAMIDAKALEETNVPETRARRSRSSFSIEANLESADLPQINRH